MKLLNKWYSLFFIFAGQISASVPSMSMDIEDKKSSNNKMHNAIASSVKNAASIEKHSNIIDVDEKKSIHKDQTVQLISDNDDYVDQNEKTNTNGLVNSLDSDENNDINEIKNESNKTEKSSMIFDHSQAKIEEKVDGDTSSEDVEKLALQAHETVVQAKEEEALKEKDVLYQEPGFIDDQESVVFNFEETDLANVASYMEAIHKVKFITEDIISTVKDAKGLAGHKITFRTNKMLTKKESWDLFITFLQIAGLDLVPMKQIGFYKIVPTTPSFAKVSSESIPTYIGVDPAVLPDNDMIVRYVYFVQNLDPAKIQNILLKFQSGSAKLDVFAELKALIFLDRANNIKSLMQIALEMDRSILPESLSVIKIKRANVADVKALYESLKSGGSAAGGQQQPHKAWALGKKESSFDYFPQDVKIFTDARTNSLILLGADKSIKKIEEFVEKYIDIDIKRDAPPIFTYQLEYTNAGDIVALLAQATQYGKGTSAGNYGGVRDGMKYFSQMTFVAEPHSNSVVINSSKDDFEALLPLIKELDTPQKQVGIEVLIVQVTDSQAKVLGSQLSGPNGPDAPGAPSVLQAQTFAQNITSQTSGILGVNGQATAPVVIQTTNGNNTAYSLKASLGALLGSTYNAVVNEPGSILVTFGQPIWALFKVLQSMVSVHVVANPFVIVSNNTPATVTIGEMRRIIASQVISVGGSTANGLTNQQSTLGFTITPQINKGNIINLSISVTNNQFTVAGSSTSALQDQKNITTNVSIANGEVLVLGGLMQEQYTSTSRGVPFLEHIPIFGWLFKSKVKTVDKSHFLVFISPRLIESIEEKEAGVDSYTLYKMKEAQKNIDIMDEIDWFASKRDPIQKAFFGEAMPKSMQELTGQEVTVKSERKQRARHKARIHAQTQATKFKSKVRDKSKPVNKKQSLDHASSGTISFDQDFVHVVPSVTPQAKNMLSGKMLKGGV